MNRVFCAVLASFAFLPCAALAQVHVIHPQPAPSMTQESGVMVYRPGQSRGARHIQIKPRQTYRAPTVQPQPGYVYDGSQVPPVPAPVPTPAPYPALPETPSSPDISYVKMGGGSDIADWELCENQAGGYISQSQTSYNVNPDFDACMREKGYKTEAEAEEELAGGLN